MHTRHARSPLYCKSTDSRSAENDVLILFSDALHCDRLGFTYATPSRVPSSDISLVRNHWIDEEEQGGQSRKLPEE